MTRPTGLPKFGTTRKNTQRYYTTKRLIRYIYIHLHIHHMSRIRFIILSFIDFVVVVVGTLIYPDNQRKCVISLTNVPILLLLIKWATIVLNKSIGRQHYKRHRRNIMMEFHSPSQTRSKIRHYSRTLSYFKIWDSWSHTSLFWSWLVELIALRILREVYSMIFVVQYINDLPPLLVKRVSPERRSVSKESREDISSSLFNIANWKENKLKLAKYIHWQC